MSLPGGQSETEIEGYQVGAQLSAVLAQGAKNFVSCLTVWLRNTYLYIPCADYTRVIDLGKYTPRTVFSCRRPRSERSSITNARFLQAGVTSSCPGIRRFATTCVIKSTSCHLTVAGGATEAKKIRYHLFMNCPAWEPQVREMWKDLGTL